MNNSIVSKILLFSFSVLFVSSAFSQKDEKTKIRITKNEDGVITEYHEEMDLNSEQSIQDILIELGLLDEFGKLKDGEAFEINIKKTDGSEELKNYDLDFESDFFVFEETPYLGVILKNNRDCSQSCEKDKASNKELEGAFIGEVMEGTGAAACGLKKCDVIYSIDKEDVKSIDDLIRIIGDKKVGDDIKIGYFRNGKKEKTTATLGKHENQELFEHIFLGEEENNANYERFNLLNSQEGGHEGNQIWFDNGNVELEKSAFLGVTPTCGDSDDDGASIASVVPGSSAEKIGIMSGDKITSFNGKAVKNFDELANEIGNTEPGSTVKIDLLREGKSKKLKGEIGEKEYSNCEEYKIFHDFKGVDEEGNIFYDYEFNVDEEDMNEIMEQLQFEMQQNMELLELEKIALNEYLEEMEQGHTESINIRIEIESVEDEELEYLNQGNADNYTNANDLEFDRISFFPNPNNGLVNLEFEINNDLPTDIIILNQTGSQIYSESLQNFEGAYANTIDISKHADGPYYLFISQDGKSYCKKLLKNK